MPRLPGAVRIDGWDLSDVTLRSLREQMAIVTQETILFNDTVWNNLCYGRPDLPEEKVHAAAQAALAHDFILEMPQRLSDSDWRPRPTAFRRPAPAAGDCARALERCADSDSR